MQYSHLLSDHNRNRVLAAMREIGAFQCAQQESAKDSACTKLDGSIVTDIDKQSQKQLADVLRQLEPRYPLLSEEREHSKNMRAIKHAGPIWVVDPLDGTKSYSEGHDEFGINVALLSASDETGNRTAVFGAVYYPAKREMYFTTKHGTAMLASFGEDGTLEQAKPLRCPRGAHPDRPLKITIGFKDCGLHHFGESYHILAHSRHTGGYRTARVLKGEYHAASFDRPAAIWDIAALAALVDAAGGHMYSIHENGKVTDTPYFGADATQYHEGKLFANPPYLCMHKSLLHKTDLVPIEVTQRAGCQR